jgi:hypothetical protein
MAQSYIKEKKDPTTLEGRVMVNVAVKPDLALQLDELCVSLEMTRSEVVRMLITYGTEATNKKGTSVINEIYKHYHKSLSEKGI